MPEEIALWKLVSSDGWGMATWRLRGMAEINEANQFLIELMITCKYWNRVQLAQHSFAAMEKTKEHTVILSQLLMGEAELRKLYVGLSEWLDEPAHDLTYVPLNLSLELCDPEHQSLKIEFGARDEIIPAHGAMACTIAYRGSHLNGESYFAVDQIGIRAFADGLGVLFDIPSAA
jgi:hypothetical protein